MKFKTGATNQEQISEVKMIPKEGWLQVVRRFAKEKPAGTAGGIILILMVLVAILAPWLVTQDPTLTDVLNRLDTPSWAHLLGTDDLGRDIFSRLVYGARTSMLVGISSVLLGTSVGALIGIISGYLGGWVDMVVQRFMDMMMAFPSLILALAIMAVLGPSTINVIIAISITSIPRTNRVVRSVAVSVKGLTYIESAKAVGASQLRIIFRHVLPNCLASYLIIATAMLSGAIVVESSLSFLGLGVPPPHPSWGRSLADSMNFYYSAPLAAVFPGLAISIVVFAANMLGDALRDIWDPRLKRL